MFKALLLLPLVLITTQALSQSDAEIEEISELTCSCLEAKDKDLKKSSSGEIQMELGLCLLAAAGDVGVDLDMTNPKSIESLGEQVGMQMAFTCPYFTSLMGQIMEDDPDMIMDALEDDDDDYLFGYKSSAGKVTAVEFDEFVVLKLDSEDGRRESYYWFEYFDGARMLEDKGNGLVGKYVIVEYKELEVYSPLLEDYRTIRVLQSLVID